MDQPQLVIFDIAGTTVHDDGQVADAFSAALGEYGVAVTPQSLRKVRGGSKRQAVYDLIPEGPNRRRDADRVYDSFREHLRKRFTEAGVRAIAGAEDVFRRLHGGQIRVALNTGFDRDITSLLLAALGWDKATVDAVVCGDDVSQGRPAPYMIFRAMEATGAASVQQVAVVGDTVLDLQAGRNAGVRWNIGVLTGAHERHLLQQAPHTHLIPSVACLCDVWNGL